MKIGAASGLRVLSDRRGTAIQHMNDADAWRSVQVSRISEAKWAWRKAAKVTIVHSCAGAGWS